MFKSGNEPWNRGKQGHLSEVTLEKMSKASEKRWKDKEYRTVMMNAHIGTHHTKETKQKQREKKLGEKNPLWVGNAVKYRGLHRWIHNNKPRPERCEKCNDKPPYDVANISGEYKRDIADYQWLCRRCHMLSDGRMEKLHPEVV